MTDWVARKVDEVAELLDNRRVPVNEDERAVRRGNVPYYGANGLQGFIDKPIFNEPLILLAEDGGNFDDFETRPIAYQVDGPSWVNNHAHVLRAKPGIDQDFLFYALEHKDIRRWIKGGTRGKLNGGDLRCVEVMLPASVGEQRRIAELLSAVDEQIELLEEAAAKESARALGLLQALLPRGFDVETLPKGRLGDSLIAIEAGKSFLCSDTPAPEGAWGVLKVSAVRPEGFVASENKRVENLALVNPRYEVKDGDLLMTRANTPELIGAACLVHAPQGRLLLCDKTLRLRPKPDVIPRFIWLWLQTPVARRHVDAHATGTSAGMKNISQTAIRSLPVDLPSREEQASLVRPMVAQYGYMQSLLSASKKLKRIKAGLAASLLRPEA